MKKRKNCKVKSIKIIIKTDDGTKKFATKNPSAIIACSSRREKEDLAKGGIQIVGEENDILFAYFMLTRRLIKILGSKLVIRTLFLVFKKDLKEFKGKLELAKMASFGKSDKKSIN